MHHLTVHDNNSDRVERVQSDRRAVCWLQEGSVLASGGQCAGFRRAVCWLQEGSVLASGGQCAGFRRAVCWLQEGSVLASGGQGRLLSCLPLNPALARIVAVSGVSPAGGGL
ncbi:hypothetical protein CesoFtcFv8_025102 [Champsocephalus esox]|uniref:Uncharacterized protein n=1 Tax=Champsocephalus esox TaxID=159716 RepID=A0AAN8GG49_9TELE|nr:hypothetical protein CesoFtcFv8_025102 [Champsocephalus esox]